MLIFAYEGADGLYQSLSVSFSPPPQKSEATWAHFQFTMEPNGVKELFVSLIVAESVTGEQVKPRSEFQPGLHGIRDYFKDTLEEWLQGWAKISSDSTLLNHLLDRSLRDLRMLSIRLDGEN